MITPSPSGYGFAPPTYHVHRCSPDEHPTHRRIGMTDPDRWYLLMQDGCVGTVTAFDTEAEARAAGEAAVAAALDEQRRYLR
jgi:hypothetical protein